MSAYLLKHRPSACCLSRQDLSDRQGETLLTEEASAADFIRMHFKSCNYLFQIHAFCHFAGGLNIFLHVAFEIIVILQEIIPPTTCL